MDSIQLLYAYIGLTCNKALMPMCIRDFNARMRGRAQLLFASIVICYDLSLDLNVINQNRNSLLKWELANEKYDFISKDIIFIL